MNAFGRAVVIGALGLLLGLFATPVGAAQAIPEDGAGANTPGTASSVAPRALRAGETLSFTLSGFPAGETVYLKIDDGQSCSAAAVHGACVQHLQRISARGTVSGSFTLPADLKPGKHWLRFLASAEVRDADGGYQGIKGYTNRSPNFTVTAGTASQPGTTTSPGSNQPGTSPGATGTDDGTSAGTSTGTSTGTDAGVQSAGKEKALIAPSMPVADTGATPDVEVAETTTDAADVPQAAAAAPEPDAGRFPYLGAGVLALCLLAAAWLLVRGRRVTVGG